MPWVFSAPEHLYGGQVQGLHIEFAKGQVTRHWDGVRILARLVQRHALFGKYPILPTCSLQGVIRPLE